MEQVRLMQKPEITLPGGYSSMYGGYTGWGNHYYAMRPTLWKKDVGISVKKEELNVKEPDQQGADPAEKFEKATYQDKARDIMKNIRYKDNNQTPGGYEVPTL
jgi:hypothetical protein